MNTYQIAQRRSRVQMDPELLRNFETLRSTLRWRPLTANLESCEEGQFLYFRITLRLTGGGGSTYAGFASGAPFMLTRDCLEKKKGFFLRHWVRQDSDASTNLALYSSPFMQLAVVKDVMIVRVDIDREMTLADTFKSVPFATWMFQVVQVDAMIDDAPGIRFAFAIERTVTSDERVVIMSNVEHTKQQTKIQKAASKISSQRVAPIRMPPPQQGQQLDQSRVIKQLPIAKTPVGGKRASASRQTVQNKQAVQARPVTIANPGGIVAKTLNPQNAITLPAVPLAPHPRPGVVLIQNVRPRPIARASNSRAQQQATPQSGVYHPLPPQLPEKRIFHPYLKLWENRQLDDPYEPFFIVDSDENTSKMSKSWRVEDSSNLSLQFNYRRLQCMPGVDYPQYFLETPDANYMGNDVQELCIVHPCKKAKGHEYSVPVTKEAGDKVGVATLPDVPSRKVSINGIDLEEPTAKFSSSKTHVEAIELQTIGNERPLGDSNVPSHEDVALNDRAFLEVNKSSVSPDPSPSEKLIATSAKTQLLKPFTLSPPVPVKSVANVYIPKPTLSYVPESLLRSAPLKTNSANSVVNPTNISNEVQERKNASIQDNLPRSNDQANQAEKDPGKSQKITVDESVKASAADRVHPAHAQSGEPGVQNICVFADRATQIDEEGEEASTIEYITAVKAATEYNSSLAVDRLELQSWLVEDRRIEEEEDGSKDDDDASLSSE